MAILLLSALLLQDPLTAAQERLNRHAWEDRLALGDWCRSVGLNTDAAAHYRFVRDGIKEAHPYRTRAENSLKGGWVGKADTAGESARAEQAKRLAAYVREAGDLAFACHLAAKKAGRKEQAGQWLLRALEFDADHEATRKARGEVRIDAFGWVPEAEAEEWKASPSSEHFVLRCDGPAEQALERLEATRAEFLELVGGRFTLPPGKLGVVWLLDGEAFENVRARVPGAAASISSFYSHLTNIAYGHGSLSSLAHEAVHQLADVGAGARRSILLTGGTRGDSRRDYWVVEGLACHLANGKPPLLPEGFDRAAFMKMDFAAFERDPGRNYPLAHALFSEIAGGAKREKFLDFVRAFYDGGADFTKMVGP